ncbi:helix-turn-helix domain-containing protein (plasmid) [Leisingera sp. NJS201]|nr:helix-turn-helix domain-containing protein [Leisingera sp. NJS201]
MACFVDGLRLAADRRDDSRQVYFSWRFVNAGSGPISSSCGLSMDGEPDLPPLTEIDCLVVCGGLLRDFDQIPEQTFEYLRQTHALGKPLIGLCTGSFLLAKAGLLDRCEVALAPSVLDAFLQRFTNAKPRVDRGMIVENNICTCPGSIAAIDVMSMLVAQSANETRARKAQDYLLYKPEESPFTLKAKPYAEALRTASSLTAEAVRMMEFQIDAPCSITRLARSLNTSPSRLTRAFHRDMRSSPSDFWLDIRLWVAQELLAGRKQTITAIAYETGFCDAAHFCKVFKKKYNVTPRTFQQNKKI